MFSLQVLFLVVTGFCSLAASDNTCLANNCERAFNGDAHTASAKAFCANFTTATTLTTNGFPAYATPACSHVSQISSICSCAYPMTASMKYGPGCLADNCLRAFANNNGQQFCSSFTVGAVTTLPTYKTMCTGSTVSRVSSACSCLNYYNSHTAPPTTSTSSSTMAASSSQSSNKLTAIGSSSSSGQSGSSSSSPSSSNTSSAAPSGLSARSIPSETPKSDLAVPSAVTSSFDSSQTQPGGPFIPYSAASASAAAESAAPMVPVDPLLEIIIG